MASNLAQYLAQATHVQQGFGTPGEEKAAGIRDLYKQGLQQLRGARNMHPEARRVEIARLYATTRQALAKVKADQVNADREAFTKLERRLWGYDDVRATATDRASVDATIRDAQDRAAQLKTEGDAARALARAEQAGDTVLARAIAQRANAHDWNTVVADYLATRPAATELYQQAAAIHQRHSTPDGVLTLQQLTALGKPEELRGLADQDIEAMADPGDTAA
jgi:hypothetical protein